MGGEGSERQKVQFCFVFWGSVLEGSSLGGQKRSFFFVGGRRERKVVKFLGDRGDEKEARGQVCFWARGGGREKEEVDFFGGVREKREGSSFLWEGGREVKF